MVVSSTSTDNRRFAHSKTSICRIFLKLGIDSRTLNLTKLEAQHRSGRYHDSHTCNHFHWIFENFCTLAWRGSHTDTLHDYNSDLYRSLCDQDRHTCRDLHSKFYQPGSFQLSYKRIHKLEMIERIYHEDMRMIEGTRNYTLVDPNISYLKRSCSLVMVYRWIWEHGDECGWKGCLDWKRWGLWLKIERNLIKNLEKGAKFEKLMRKNLNFLIKNPKKFFFRILIIIFNKFNNFLPIKKTPKRRIFSILKTFCGLSGLQL